MKKRHLTMVCLLAVTLTACGSAGTGPGNAPVPEAEMAVSPPAVHCTETRFITVRPPDSPMTAPERLVSSPPKT